MKISIKNIIWSVISISFGIMFFALAVMVLFWGGRKGYSFGVAVFDEKPVSSGLGKSVLVDIKADMDDRAVAKYIKSVGLVEDENVFFVQILLSDYKKKYVAGKYMLSTDMIPTDILKTICSGEFYVDPLEVETPDENPGIIENEGPVHNAEGDGIIE